MRANICETLARVTQRGTNALPDREWFRARNTAAVQLSSDAFGTRQSFSRQS